VAILKYTPPRERSGVPKHSICFQSTRSAGGLAEARVGLDPESEDRTILIGVPRVLWGWLRKGPLG